MTEISRDQAILFAREALGLSESTPIKILPLGGRGSDRNFHRLKWSGDHSAILIQYDPKRLENTYYADLDVFLNNAGIPVPKLIRHDQAASLILMEDLGDKDLWSFREKSRETRRRLYEKTLTIVHRLHSFALENLPADRIRLMDPFSPELYRWERDYFMDNFIREFCGIDLSTAFRKELEAELSGLAERLLNSGRCLIHRDLQSQNVMVRAGEPFLIDFQGMRFGTPFYDLGSLLYDPYVEFPAGGREELLLFYYNLSTRGFDLPTFQEFFREASAQRLMQALGAYGFLGLGKGLKHFLDHIPQGLRNLHDAASKSTSLPHLQSLILQCEREISCPKAD
jgi:N-acetylmuramate 1-kinase